MRGRSTVRVNRKALSSLLALFLVKTGYYDEPHGEGIVEWMTNHSTGKTRSYSLFLPMDVEAMKAVLKALNIK